MYQLDLTQNKSLLNNLNRHTDNYSSTNLNEEILLVTALISLHLQSANFNDVEMLPTHCKNLTSLVELKRRLFETNCKIEDMILKSVIIEREHLGKGKDANKALIQRIFLHVEDLLTQEQLETLMMRLENEIKITAEK